MGRKLPSLAKGSKEGLGVVSAFHGKGIAICPCSEEPFIRLEPWLGNVCSVTTIFNNSTTYLRSMVLELCVFVQPS